MNFLRDFFRKPHRVVDDPQALRDQLFTAANKGDGATLRALCTANRATIVQHFPAWANMKSMLCVSTTAVVARFVASTSFCRTLVSLIKQSPQQWRYLP